MADVGGVSFNIMRGEIREPTERVDSYQVPGIDGYGAQLLGLDDSPFSLTITKFGTEADLDAWISAMNAKQGVVLTIKDNRDKEHTNCLIKTMEIREREAALPANMCRCKMYIAGVRS